MRSLFETDWKTNKAGTKFTRTFNSLTLTVLAVDEGWAFEIAEGSGVIGEADGFATSSEACTMAYNYANAYLATPEPA